MSVQSERVTRRNAVGMLGLLGIGAAGAAVAPNVNQMSHGSVLAAQHEHAFQTAADVDMATVDEMDDMHEAGVLAFPAETEGLGGQPLPYTMDGDVKVFELECSVFDWEFRPGEFA